MDYSNIFLDTSVLVDVCPPGWYRPYKARVDQVNMIIDLIENNLMSSDNTVNVLLESLDVPTKVKILWVICPVEDRVVSNKDIILVTPFIKALQQALFNN